MDVVFVSFTLVKLLTQISLQEYTSFSHITMKGKYTPLI